MVLKHRVSIPIIRRKLHSSGERHQTIAAAALVSGQAKEVPGEAITALVPRVHVQVAHGGPHVAPCRSHGGGPLEESGGGEGQQGGAERWGAHEGPILLVG